MKRIFSITLVLAMILSLASCGLFSNDSVVKLGDYTHNDPKDLKYDKRVVLKGENFGENLASNMSQEAYPDTMVYDKSGNPIGMYEYDESTGLATGWTKFGDNSHIDFEKGKEVNLGKPDESKMVKFSDAVALYAVAYGNEDKPVSTYYYIFLKNKADKDTVKSGMENIYGLKFTEENDTVLTAVQDEKAINEVIKQIAEASGESSAEDINFDSYVNSLVNDYQIKKESNAAIKPFAGYTDPTDFEYDKKVVLAGSAEYAVDENLISDVTSLTSVIYGKDGNVVANFNYYECPSKESADKIAESLKSANPKHISDTVICISYTGKEMQNELKKYMGYKIIKDTSIDEYIRMNEDTFLISVCE